MIFHIISGSLVQLDDKSDRNLQAVLWSMNNRNPLAPSMASNAERNYGERISSTPETRESYGFLKNLNKRAVIEDNNSGNPLVTKEGRITDLYKIVMTLCRPPIMGIIPTDDITRKFCNRALPLIFKT